MKIFFLIFGFFILAFNSFGEGSVLIQDAVDQKLIDYSLTGTMNPNEMQQYLDADGQYFGKCMTINLHSRIDSSVFIFFYNGLMLMSEDLTAQNMIITKQMYVYLNPRQYMKIRLYAMCSEIHKAMPHNQIKYRIGAMAGDSLKAIAETIDNMYMNNIAGEGAVWAFTDRADENDLRRYGATDNSIQLTIDILNRAGVVTKLNPIKTDTLSKQLDAPALSDGLNENYISIDRNILFFICGFTVFLFVTTIILIFKKQN